MNKGVFLDLDSLDRGDLDLSELKSTLPEWEFYSETTPDQVLSRISDAAVVVSNKVMLDEGILTRVSDLKLVCVAATGTNNVDIPAATSQGVMVCNARGYATPSVTEHVFSLMLALVRKLPEYTLRVREGAWQGSSQFCLLDFPMAELAGKKLGIIGFGELGQSVARVAECFGMEVLVAQRAGGALKGGRLPLRELLPQVDLLSIHCPLTDETMNLIAEEELKLMKPSAILINTARGGIVNEADLANALKGHRLGGAGVDVLQQEPPHSDNPLLAGDIPNLIVTPHIAWASREARQRLVNELVLNIQAYLQGQPRNRVE